MATRRLARSLFGLSAAALIARAWGCIISLPFVSTTRVGIQELWDDVEVPSFQRRAKCGCRRVDVRPHWKEQPPTESLTRKQWR